MTADRVVRTRAAASPGKLVLPTGRRDPESNPYAYAYHITGPYKIGKTSLAIAGCEELVIQLDKPNLAYDIREMCPEIWSDKSGGRLGFMQILVVLERLARAGEFMYGRIVIDGVAELYQMCLEWVSKERHIGHPGEEEDFGASWSAVNAEFKGAVNRLLRLQVMASCGLFLISHTEWKERPIKGTKTTQSVLVSNLSKGCGSVVNGKCDATFVYIWDGDQRVLYLLGDETVQAGNRIDGHFMTTDGRRIRALHMGDDTTDAAFAHAQFAAAFKNDLEHANLEEALAAKVANSPTRRRRRRRVEPTN